MTETDRRRLPGGYLSLISQAWSGLAAMFSHDAFPGPECQVNITV
jgi:hypothetical protein